MKTPGLTLHTNSPAVPQERIPVCQPQGAGSAAATQIPAAGRSCHYPDSRGPSSWSAKTDQAAPSVAAPVGIREEPRSRSAPGPQRRACAQRVMVWSDSSHTAAHHDRLPGTENLSPRSGHNSGPPLGSCSHQGAACCAKCCDLWLPDTAKSTSTTC